MRPVFLAHLSFYNHPKAGFASRIKDQMFKKGKENILSCRMLNIFKLCKALFFPEDQFSLIINRGFFKAHFLAHFPILHCFLWTLHTLPRGRDPDLRHTGRGTTLPPLSDQLLCSGPLWQTWGFPWLQKIPQLPTEPISASYCSLRQNTFPHIQPKSPLWQMK